MKRSRLLVLAYHSINVGSSEYELNDHLAFAEDLKIMTLMGWRIEPLAAVTEAWLAGRDIPPRTLALTLDDGADFDFHDLPHPTWGMQRSMLGIMGDFRARYPHAQPGLHATSFVIVSPEARKILDRTCMIGKGWWNDDWWAAANASGLMHIASHSWDHNHDTLPETRQHDQHKGTFFNIDTRADADGQIADSLNYIGKIAPNPGQALFAYPYGEAADYLVDEYFPDTVLNPGVMAAFGCQGGMMTESSNPWNLPRNTCGLHWKKPEELETMLRDFGG